MKKFFSVLITFSLITCSLTVTVFAANTKTEKVDLDPSYKEIADLIDDIVIYANSAINDENREKLYIGENDALSEITQENIDLSAMCKFYYASDEIINCKTEEEILSVLKNSRYNWVLPLFIDDLVLEITISKTYDFSEEETEKLTRSERSDIIRNKGYYHISSMVLTDKVSFWTEAIKNGQMTYFVNLSPMSAALQIRNNKCYLLCKTGEAAGDYVSAERIEIKSSSELRTGMPSYTLKPLAISWTIATISFIVALITSCIVFIITIKKKKLNESK